MEMDFVKMTAKIEKIDCIAEEEGMENIRHKVRSYEFREQIQSSTKVFNSKLPDSVFLTASLIDGRQIVACAIADNAIDFRRVCLDYVDHLGIDVKDMSFEDIGFMPFKDLLHTADRNDYIEDEDDVFSMFKICVLNRYFRYDFQEHVRKPQAARRTKADLRRILTASGLKDELARIDSADATTCPYGHPVHYIIRSDDDECLAKTADILLDELIRHRRVANRRYCKVPLDFLANNSNQCLDAIFKISEGGTILVTCERSSLDLETDKVDGFLDCVEKICDNVRKHRHDVLAIFLLPKECTQLKNYLFENLGALSFVEVEEEAATKAVAKRFLRTMAKDKDAKADDGLFEMLEDGRTYLTKELRSMFDEWYSKKLRTDIYPQYSAFQTAGTRELNSGPRGNAYEDLMAMVGLEGAKKVIDQAISFGKMQRYLVSKDIVRERPSMHMVFTGNPGTAKTTVARLFARIMKDNKLISSGQLIEVGRGDLVGKYVGHTAPLVQSYFKKAEGGVLFIDEAYSLVDDKDGLFGDEAINAIVQEMENRRDSVIVIFAGYTDKMEQFLSKNPGLRSRISFHVPFSDYTPQELCQISKLIAAKKSIEITDEAASKLEGVFANACEEHDFGNGRYARSIIEKALMAQAVRLMALDPENLANRQLCTLTEEDIEEPPARKQAHHPIGFRA